MLRLPYIVFIARISKNRTLRSVIVGVFLAPTAYALIWYVRASACQFLLGTMLPHTLPLSLTSTSHKGSLSWEALDFANSVRRWSLRC